MRCDNLDQLMLRVAVVCADFDIKAIDLAREIGVNRSQVTRWLKRETKPSGSAVMKLQEWVNQRRRRPCRKNCK